LPVKDAPYTIAPDTFHPLPGDERLAIRRNLGLDERDFVVGNFHRDSLERDLSVPKAQKGPDLFVSVVEEARKRVPSLKVLLAGPRRHWLRSELSRRKIPYIFCGKVLEGDDFFQNRLPRRELNRLYAALDCVLISSRWEGGPYAVLEALFSGRPVVSTPVGMAADLLKGWVYSSQEEAADMLARIASGATDFSTLRGVAMKSHSSEKLARSLIDVYSGLPNGPESTARAVTTVLTRNMARIFPKFRESQEINARVGDVMRRLRNGNPGPERVLAAAQSIVQIKRTLEKGVE
jgi:glycosyltransferase involved in cell wall biosynthesis